ncbi:MAG: hypothetical protein BroJett018_37400 [Chloroflexota bacterium]|nr:MAG: hypothetical protein BroJett018_37400 [Chloroflexota bacterium]
MSLYVQMTNATEKAVKTAPKIVTPARTRLFRVSVLMNRDSRCLVGIGYLHSTTWAKIKSNQWGKV